MNDLYVAAGGAGAAAVLFLVSAVRRAHDTEYRIWLGVGLAFLAATFAILFYDLGNVFDRLGDAAHQLETDLGGITDTTDTTVANQSGISEEECISLLGNPDATIPDDCAAYGINP
jgi:hypothetical protein